jgi:hypothetical protein
MSPYKSPLCGQALSSPKKHMLMFPATPHVNPTKEFWLQPKTFWSTSNFCNERTSTRHYGFNAVTTIEYAESDHSKFRP